jgi:hypothetical protein
MSAHIESDSQSPWRVDTWVARIRRLVGRPHAAASRAAAVPPTRRQQLLAAQDLKKGEQRSRTLALLREIKREGRRGARGPLPPPRITGK